jgi:hypothetical protein
MACQHASAHRGYLGGTRAVQHRALGLRARWPRKTLVHLRASLPQDAALQAFDKVLRRRTRKIFLKNQPQYWLPPLRGGRLIVKDPIAALSSDWLARNFDFEVVVLVRHPAAFAASLKRLNWRHPFEHFLHQEILMERYLEPYRAEIASKPENIAEQAAIIWKCIYGVLFDYLDTNAHWLVKKHEVLSSNPVAELRNLCKGLGLEWTKTVEDDVVKYTRSGNPVTGPEGTVHQIRRDSSAIVSRWKEILAKDEIAGVYRITRPVSDGFYADEDWVT